MITRNLKNLKLLVVVTFLGLAGLAYGTPTLEITPAGVDSNSFAVTINLTGAEDGIQLKFTTRPGTQFASSTAVVDGHPFAFPADPGGVDTRLLFPLFNSPDNNPAVGTTVTRVGALTKSATEVRGAYGVPGGTFASGAFPLARLNLDQVSGGTLEIKVTEPGGVVVLDTFLGSPSATGAPIFLGAVPVPEPATASFFIVLAGFCYFRKRRDFADSIDDQFV